MGRHRKNCHIPDASTIDRFRAWKPPSCQKVTVKPIRAQYLYGSGPMRCVHSTTHPHHVNPVLPLFSVSANIGDLELNAAHEELVGNWDALGSPPDSDDVLGDRKIPTLTNSPDLIQKTK